MQKASLQESLNSIFKLTADLIRWFQDAYFSWKEGAETGVISSSDEDVPNSAKQISQYIKCAGALWKPYYDNDEGTVYLPTYLAGEVGPFCLECKGPVEREGRTIFRPYFKWRCPRNHIHRIPDWFQKDLLSRAKKQILWDLRRHSRNA
jgi:hypothetical protein